MMGKGYLRNNGIMWENNIISKGEKLGEQGKRSVRIGNLAQWLVALMYSRAAHSLRPCPILNYLAFCFGSFNAKFIPD